MGVDLKRSTILAGIALLVVAACTSGNMVEILRASPVDGDPAAVEVEFSGCETQPDVDVTETDETVEIALKVPPSGCEPLHHLVVEVDQPLGDREVVDAGDGDVVPIVDTFQ